MGWIESHQELRDHPKVYCLSEMLQIEKAQAIGHLHLFWWWCVDYAKTGRLAGFNDPQLARAAEWSGDPKMFVEGMVQARFLDRADGVLTVHDWLEFRLYADLFQMKKEEKRNQALQRMRRFREKGGGDPDHWIAIRKRILERDNYLCAYCGKLAQWVDHIIPRSKGGKEKWENLVASCKGCNMRKTNKTLDEADMSFCQGFDVRRLAECNTPVTPPLHPLKEPNQTEPNQTERTKPPPPPPSSQAETLALALKSLILRNNATAKVPKDSELARWAREADRLLRRVKDHDEIMRVLSWCQSDYGDGGKWRGWSAVVLSMGKFIEKYDTLKLQMENYEKSKRSPGQRTAANLQRVFGGAE